MNKKEFLKLKKDSQTWLNYLQQKSENLFEFDKEEQSEKEIANREFDIKDVCLYRIKEITYEKDAPRREVIENVFGAFNGYEGINLVYILLGNKNGIELYLGIVKDFKSSKDVDVFDLGKNILEPSLKSNFRGCIIEEVEKNDDKLNLVNRWRRIDLRKNDNAKNNDRKNKKNKPYGGILTGVPNVQKNDDAVEKQNFQGVDRLIDFMQSKDFGMIVIAKPYSQREMYLNQKRLFEIHDVLAATAAYSCQFTEGESLSNQHSNGKDYSCSANENTHKNDGHSVNESRNEDHHDDLTNQVSASESENHNQTVNRDRSFSATEDSNGSKDHETATMTGALSDQGGKSYNKNVSNSFATSKHCSVGYSEQTSYGLDVSYSNSYQQTESDSTQGTSSESANKNYQMEFKPALANSWMDCLEKVLIPKSNAGFAKGLFTTTVYLYAPTIGELEALGSAAKAIFSSSNESKVPLTFKKLCVDNKDIFCENVLCDLENLQLPFVKRKEGYCEHDTALSLNVQNDGVFYGNCLSVQELGVLANVPQKDVIGLSLREEVEFGLNKEWDGSEKNCSTDNNYFELGELIKGGNPTGVPVRIDKDMLNKHIFVAGVTGSGKTVTCQNILLNAKMPFLVIEPAKTEYRILKKKLCEDLVIFTPGNQNVGTFFLNPFEIFPGEAISSRVDMLMATLEASVHMEAAIPQIFEEAMYETYKSFGWNIKNNTWNGQRTDEFDEGPFAYGVYAFPTLRDFSLMVEKIVEKKNFDDRLRDEYLGTIRSLLSGLMVGAKGMMLNVRRSLNFKDLVKKHVLIELEEIKSGKEKSLIMGFILTNLAQAVKYCYEKEGTEFRHITLVEEAHRLLSRYVQGDSQNKKQGVEVFADMLAEIRKYGESLIIVDQIPEKMTPEVLKNTNTKIVHRLFAQDDKDAIGNAIALTDEQKTFLSSLKPGRAVVFTGGWSKSVQVKVKMQYDTTSDEQFNDTEIMKSTMEFYSDDEVVKSGVLGGWRKEFKKDSKDSVAKRLLCLLNDDAADVFRRMADDKITEVEKFGEFLFDSVKNFKGIQEVSVEDYVEYLYDLVFVQQNDNCYKVLLDVIKKFWEVEDYGDLEKKLWADNFNVIYNGVISKGV